MTLCCVLALEGVKVFMGWDQMKVRVGGRLSSVRAPLMVVPLPEVCTGVSREEEEEGSIACECASEGLRGVERDKEEGKGVRSTICSVDV